MKSIALLITTLLAAAILTACGAGAGQTTDANTGSQLTSPAPASHADMTELLQRVHQISAESGIEFPTLETSAVPTDDTLTFEFLFGIKPTDAVASAAITQPIIGSLAYAVGAIKVTDPANGSEVADAVQSGVDPNRWVCVTASVVRTVCVGDVVLLVMDTVPARADAVVAAFEQVMRG